MENIRVQHFNYFWWESEGRRIIFREIDTFVYPDVKTWILVQVGKEKIDRNVACVCFKLSWFLVFYPLEIFLIELLFLKHVRIASVGISSLSMSHDAAFACMFSVPKCREGKKERAERLGLEWRRSCCWSIACFLSVKPVWDSVLRCWWTSGVLVTEYCDSD
jgi:hypothetical protein